MRKSNGYTLDNIHFSVDRDKEGDLKISKLDVFETMP